MLPPSVHFRTFPYISVLPHIAFSCVPTGLAIFDDILPRAKARGYDHIAPPGLGGFRHRGFYSSSTSYGVYGWERLGTDGNEWERMGMVG